MRTALIDSTPDFLRFLDAARATPGDRWGQYEEAYLSTHGAVLQGMLATHLFWLGLSMRELVERMDLGWYADRVQAWQKRDGSREIALALQAAEKALPPLASFPPEVNLIWGFGMVDGGLTFARGHPVLILGLELVAVNRNLAHLVQHEYAHLVRIAHPETIRDLMPPHVDLNDPVELTRLMQRVPAREMLVNEGLATLCPAYIAGAPITPELLRELLFWSPEQMAAAQERQGEMWERALAAWDRPWPETDMFVGQSAFLPDGTPSRYGYYVGASMVARLISERGWHAYPDLLVSDAKRVLALFEQATIEKP
ncbi:MAG: hypothetical protein AB1446_04220 [Bacillota bacterium]